jgi:2'-hydroxyisoflavone reductase
MTDRRNFLRLSATVGGALALGGWRDGSLASSLGRGALAASEPERAPERAPRSLRILILGGTGLTGPHQVRYALERGHRVTVFNRGRRNDRLPKGVEELRGDRNLHEVQALKGKEWDVVIDNPTTFPFWVKDAAEVLKGHTNQYVFISTISVYDPAGQTSITEDSPRVRYTDGDPLAVTPEQARDRFEFFYGRMKTASEEEALRWFGDRATIIRPGLIVGPGDGSFRFGYWPYRIERGGEILAPGDGTDPIQIIDARDLAEWTIRMVENGTTGVFNGTGPRARMSMAEQLHGIRAAFDGNRELSFTWVASDFLAKQQVAPWMEMPTWIPSSDPEHVISMTSNARAIAAGLTFRPLATTAVDTQAWLMTLPEQARAQVVKNAGLPPEKEQAVLAAWHREQR